MPSSHVLASPVIRRAIRRTLRSAPYGLLFIALVGCGNPSPGADGGDANVTFDATNQIDGGTDGGTPDVGTVIDSGPPPACTLHATTTTLANTFESAGAGAVICLAAGDYGTFHGGTKPGRVTLQPEAGATVSMSIAFSASQNITIDGMTISDLDMSRSRDITVSHSRFSGQAVVHVGTIAAANILFDSNSHMGVPTCASCLAAQLHADPEGSEPSGLTIRNSRFGGSFSDGVRADANSIVIEGNEFSGLVDTEPYHTDPIQIYGGRNITIRGNYFHDNAVASNIAGWDGNDHNIVEDNVIVGSPATGQAISLLSDNGSVIQHNTLVQGSCAYGWHCGIVDISHKTTDPASTGTIIRDNVLSEISDMDATYTADHNLFTGMQTPVYVGPATSYAGYRLATGSPGVGMASDGMDVGIRP